MRKITKILLFLTFSAHWLNAQIISDSMVATNGDSLFQLLDTSLINTGILMEIR